MEYNKLHNKVPKQINKAIESSLLTATNRSVNEVDNTNYTKDIVNYSEKQKMTLLKELKNKMETAAKDLDFLAAAKYRDEIKTLKESL